MLLTFHACQCFEGSAGLLLTVYCVMIHKLSILDCNTLSETKRTLIFCQCKKCIAFYGLMEHPIPSFLFAYFPAKLSILFFIFIPNLEPIIMLLSTGPSFTAISLYTIIQL